MTEEFTEGVIEHLGFAPVHFVDDLINHVNAQLYKSMSKLETVLQKELGQGMELEKGMASIETLFENTLDKRFDRLEVFLLKNVFSISHDITRLLPHYKELPLDLGVDDEKLLDQEMEDLRKQLVASRYMQVKLDEELLLLNQAKTQLESIQSQLNVFKDIAGKENVYPLSTSFDSIASKVMQLHGVTSQVQTRSMHPSTHERIVESENHTRLMQSDILMHIKKRQEMDAYVSGQQQACDAQVGAMKVSAWDVTREYRDAMAIGSVIELKALKEIVMA